MAGKAAAPGAATSEAGGKAAETPTTPDAGKTAEAGKTGDAGKTSTDTKTDDQAGGKTKTDDQAGKTTDEGKGKETQSDKKADEQKAGDESAAAQKKAPAEYKLTVPDDAKRFVSDEDLERFQEIARANDWTQDEAAQALEEELTFAKTKQAKTIETWETETKKDKTYGGKNLSESQRLGNLVIDRVYPKDHPMRERFIGFLKESGGGVRLEVVAFLADLGRMMGEDRPSSSRSTSTSSEEKADKFYDHPTSKKVAEAAKG